MESKLRRREVVATGVAAAGALALGPEFWQSLAKPARVGFGPYGPLGPVDANGLRLPHGFSSRVIARGLQPVERTGYLWHIFSDGGATFSTPDGGWILVSNSELPSAIDLPIDPPIGNPGEGGASAIRFAADATIVDAYRILSGTSTNCAGGPTPWGTWLSCEETGQGMVWECDPSGEREAVAHPALGVFTHEAVCVDRRTGFLYLSEDEADGCFYRFRPARGRGLGEGRLQVARVRKPSGRVKWIDVPDPSAAEVPTRLQVADATKFRRGEGIWFDSGVVYLATTGDSRIWAYDTRRRVMRKIYDPEKVTDAPLTDVDNVTVHPPSGDLFVCEDNGHPDAFDIALITPGDRDGRARRTVARFTKLTGTEHGFPETDLTSEVAGVCFNPRGDRMYFASQRAGVVGAVYEVTGPFRRRRGRPGRS
ncbi:MAG: alkaline phosphatase PhoX [Solirubrobacterales bacterium]